MIKKFNIYSSLHWKLITATYGYQLMKKHCLVAVTTRVQQFSVFTKKANVRNVRVSNLDLYQHLNCRKWWLNSDHQIHGNMNPAHSQHARKHISYRSELRSLWRLRWLQVKKIAAFNRIKLQFKMEVFSLWILYSLLSVTFPVQLQILKWHGRLISFEVVTVSDQEIVFSFFLFQDGL